MPGENGVPLHGLRRRPSEAGFTLVEMLVALAIVGVMSSLMVVFIGQTRVLLRIESVSQAETEVDAIIGFLETIVASAEPLPLLPSTPDHVLYFKGERSEIRFSAVSPIGFGTNALREIVIRLRQSDGAGKTPLRDLALVGKPRRAREQPDDAASETTLLTNVAGLEFEYLGGSGQQISWSPTWDNQRSVPAAVRIKLSISRNGKIYSSDGLARPSLSTVR